MKREELDALIGQASQLCAPGRHREAFQLVSGALREHADDARLWNVGAAAALGLGLTEDAERFWTVATARAPDFAEAHYNLGVLLQQQGRFEASARSLARAVVLQPENAQAHNVLGVALFECGRRGEALILLQRSVELDAGNAEALNNLGLVQIELGQLEPARATLDQAVELRPDMAQALNTRGLLQVELGRLEQGIRDFDAAIALQPGYGQAHLNRALVRRAEPGAGWVARLAAAFASRQSQPPADASALAFAMGKVREDLEEFDAAFEAYAEGNRLHREQHPFDEGEDRASVEQLHARFDATVLAGAPARRLKPDESSAQRTPVFIVGMPRSGTSLLEQILSSHPQVFGAGELPLLTELLGGLPRDIPGPEMRVDEWYGRLRELGTRYVARAWGAEVTAPVLIDKMPGNHRHVGFIPLMLPRARIIHLVRDPADTCLSCYTTSFRRGHGYSYDLATLGRYYRRYARLMQHWHDVLPPGIMIDVHYEDLVRDIEGQARRILSHIGLPWDDACLRFYEKDRPVSTASFVQVRQPAYTKSMGRWRRFERHLAPLLMELSTPER